MKLSTALARAVTVRCRGDTPEERRLKEYLTELGMIDHKGDLIEGGEYFEAKFRFLAAAGLRKMFDLAGQPGPRLKPHKLEEAWMYASGGWTHPAATRNRRTSTVRA